MPRPRYIELDGKRYPWKSVVAAYNEQAKAAAVPEQPALFGDLHEDIGPPGERTAAERCREPNLFSLIGPEP